VNWSTGSNTCARGGFQVTEPDPAHVHGVPALAKAIMSGSTIFRHEVLGIPFRTLRTGEHQPRMGNRRRKITIGIRRNVAAAFMNDRSAERSKGNDEKRTAFFRKTASRKAQELMQQLKIIKDSENADDHEGSHRNHSAILPHADQGTTP